MKDDGDDDGADQTDDVQPKELVLWFFGRRTKEALRTKEIRARSRCASAPPEGLCSGSRDTECKEAER